MSSSSTDKDATAANEGTASGAGVTAMGAERWQRLKDVFAAALELPRAQRAAFVAVSCVGDAELHVRILELVRAAEVEDGFIEHCAAERLE